MKKLPTGKKIRGNGESWHKHLRPAGKHRANKGTRKALKGSEEPWANLPARLAELQKTPMLHVLGADLIDDTR